MFDRLEDLLRRYEEIMNELNEPSVTANQDRFRSLMKEQSDLTPLVEAYKEYKKVKQDAEDSMIMLESESDEEMRELLKEENSEAKRRIQELEQEMKILLLPKDPNDDKNVVVEIRAGAGGDEAALFAAEMYRLYVKYAERNRWKVELVGAGRNRHRRHEGSQLYDQRKRSLFPPEIRKRGSPCTACAGNGIRRPYPYIHHHRGGYAGSGGRGCGY